MTPALYALVCLAALAAFVMAIVIVFLPINIDMTLPEWLMRSWDAVVAMYRDPVPVCPRCGQPATLLGVSGDRRWFYCKPCESNAWQEPTLADQATAPKAVAS